MILKSFLLVSLTCITYSSFAQTQHRGRTESPGLGSSSFILCSADLVSGTAPCGCTNACVTASICDTQGGGECDRLPETLTINIPANTDMSIAIDEEGCSATGGLDMDDTYSINGQSFEGQGNTTPPYNGCFGTLGNPETLVIELDANRLNECITINVNLVSNGGVLGDGITGCTTLPIELSSFDVSILDDKSIELIWVTQQEVNSSAFEVEWSQDLKTFSKIGSIPSAGISFENREYSFVHDRPGERNNYYRLKQIDLDGEIDYSHIKDISFNPAAEISVRPTIVDHSLSVYFSSPSVGEANYSIFSSSGQLQKAGSFPQDLTQFDCDTHELPQGIYVLRILIDSKVFTQRFVKK